MKLSSFCFLFLAIPAISFGEDTTASKGRGAIVPQNLETVVQAQAMSAGVGASIVKSAQAPIKKPACSPNMPSFSWADLKKVSLVQDQGACGSCWAFAAIAALESSHLIENGIDADPRPPGAEASEQQALDCAWKAYTCAGGWHDKVFDYFVNAGQSKRPVYRKYDGKKRACGEVPARPYTALTWGFVEGANIPSAEKLKAAICEHGPVVAAVKSVGWDARTQDNMFYRYSKLNPQWAQEFPDGVFRGSASRPNLNASNIQLGDIDHDVLIVGWNNTDQAWLVKNSWGTTWGDDGFIKVAYDTQNIGFNAAWIQAASTIAPLPKEIDRLLRNINKNVKAQIFNLPRF